MKSVQLFDSELNNVSVTMLATLYSRAHESKSNNPILRDPWAEKSIAQINEQLVSNLENKMMKKLAMGKVRKDLRVHISLRAAQYDRYAREFLAENPHGTIVSLGCGLDARFHRVDNGAVRFVDIDLPEVIEIKKKLLPETARYRQLGTSVLDHAWMEKVEDGGKPAMFIAEGLFMYLPAAEVKELVQKIASSFPGSTLVCEVVNEKYTRGFYKKILNIKMNKVLGFDGVEYRWGMSDSRDMEAWGENFRLIDEWVYLDANVKKLGIMKFFRRWKSFRNTQWTVRYII